MVFDRRALGVELWGYRVLGNILIMRRKRVTRETEWANPDSCADIDSARSRSASCYHLTLTLYIRIWVEDGAAGLLAADRLILKQWRIGLLLQRGIDGGNGDDKPRGFLYRISVMRSK